VAHARQNLTIVKRNLREFLVVNCGYFEVNRRYSVFGHHYAVVFFDSSQGDPKSKPLANSIKNRIKNLQTKLGFECN